MEKSALYDAEFSPNGNQLVTVGTDETIRLWNLDGKEVEQFKGHSGPIFNIRFRSEFHTALGQYLNYRQALEEQEPDRTVYLAVPAETYKDFFLLPFIQRILQRHSVQLITYDPDKEEIRQWIKFSITDN